jgi:hypothetical protein
MIGPGGAITDTPASSATWKGAGEERDAMAALSEETFPFTLPPAAAAAAAKEGYHV